MIYWFFDVIIYNVLITNYFSSQPAEYTSIMAVNIIIIPDALFIVVVCLSIQILLIKILNFGMKMMWKLMKTSAI